MVDNPLAAGGGIWAMAGRPTVALKDPNESLRDVLATQQGVFQNNVSRAAMARGDALQQATNPLTGRTDMGRANAIMADNPLAGLAMPGAIDQAQSVNTSQADLSIKRNDYMGRALGSVLKLPDDQIHDAAAGMVSDGIAQGLIDPQSGMRTLARMPNDPTQARMHLQQMQIGAMPPGAGRDAIYGTPTSFNRGGTTEFGTTAPADAGGGFSPGSSSSMTLNPGERTTPQQIGTDGKGAPIYGTRQQFIDRTGGDPGAPGGASPMGDGRFPAALRNPNRQGGAAPAAAAPGAPAPAVAPPTPSYTSAAAGSGQAAPNAAPGGGIVMGLGVAQQAAMTRQGADSAGAFQAITDQGVQARSQGALLGTMLGDTQNFTSGEANWNNFKTGFMRNAPGLATSFGITPESVAASESFDKFANQLAQGQGAGSDARLAVAQGANPSSKMSKDGVDLVLRQLQGNADYLQARQQMAAKHPDQSDARGFEATTGAQLDPRAFQVNRMTPAQRQTYDRSLSDTDRTQVEASYNFAHDRGLFTAPTTAAPRPPAPALATAPPRAAAAVPPPAVPAPIMPGAGALSGRPDPVKNPLQVDKYRGFY